MVYPTRRAFCLSASAALLKRSAFSQARATTRPDVASLDHDRILASASRVLAEPIVPITSLPAPRSPGTPHDFYSEPDDFFPDSASAEAVWVQRKPSAANPVINNPEAFTQHRDALYKMSTSVATLAAAFVVTSEPRYAERAAVHLRAWFITPATRMTPSLQFGQRVPNLLKEQFEGVFDAVPLAEAARSVLFLKSSPVLNSDELAALRTWFGDYATWLNESRTGGLARDQKDHHGSSWLFQCAAFADANAIGLTSDDAALTALRHRLRTATLRAQTNATGNFPHEVSSANPYRASLLNLDMMALTCELLSTRFEHPWDYELQDGPGMRSAIAYHYPFILNRSAWPYPADAAHFKELPARRISLLLAGRAYARPEYTELWRSLAPLPDTAAPELLRSFPISQPPLWFNRPRS